MSRSRLIRALPEVFLGADAVAALDGRRGFLYGEKRHRQVDVFGVDPVEAATTLDEMVERRFERATIEGWRVVGLAVTAEDIEKQSELLLDGAVAGDVILAGAGAQVVRVHCGDRLAVARASRQA